MKTYRFIFLIGTLNVITPFLGVPSLYKNYITITVAIITLGYALILRAIEHEKQLAYQQQEVFETNQKTIEQVVEMETEEKIIVSDIKIKPKRKKAVAINHHE